MIMADNNIIIEGSLAACSYHKPLLNALVAPYFCERKMKRKKKKEKIAAIILKIAANSTN